MKLHMLIVAVQASAIVCFAQSPAPPDQLPSLVAELQKSPTDAALREKIIKLVNTLSPKPEIPEAARRHGIRAMTLEKDAKEAADYAGVIKEYDEALLLAPWWPEALVSQSKACEAGGQYQKAMDALKQYLLTQPAEADARTAQDKIYALEIKVEKQQQAAAEQQKREDDARAEQRRRDDASAAERQRQEQAAAARRSDAEIAERVKEDKRKAFVSKYGDARWKFTPPGGNAFSLIFSDGKTLWNHQESSGGMNETLAIVDLAEIEGNQFERYWNGHEWGADPSQNVNASATRFVISQNGRDLTMTFTDRSGVLYNNVFKRQK